MSTFDNKYDDGDHRICPYCSHKFEVESCDHDEMGGDRECEECGKKYKYHEYTTVTHVTEPDCQLNGEDHDYDDHDLGNLGIVKFCKICGQIEPWDDKKARLAAEKNS